MVFICNFSSILNKLDICDSIIVVKMRLYLTPLYDTLKCP